MSETSGIVLGCAANAQKELQTAMMLAAQDELLRSAEYRQQVRDELIAARSLIEMIEQKVAATWTQPAAEPLEAAVLS